MDALPLKEQNRDPEAQGGAWADLDLPVTKPRFAGLGHRFAALVLDYALVSIACYAINVGVGGLAATLLGPRAGGWLIVLATIFTGVPVWMAYATVMVARYGGTLGSMAVETHIARVDRQPMDARTAFIRAAVMLLSMALLFVGFLVAFFDPDRQTLHDKLARTYVVEGKSPMTEWALTSVDSYRKD